MCDKCEKEILVHEGAERFKKCNELDFDICADCFENHATDEELKECPTWMRII